MSEVKQIYLKDSSNNVVSPVTSIDSVYDESGNSVGNYIVNLIYPVGSIYMSVNTVSPSTLFGGTWEQIEDTFLLSSGSTYTNGETGGEAEHTLTEDELAEHTHDVSGGSHSHSFSATTSSNGAHTHTTYYLTDNSCSSSGQRWSNSSNYDGSRTNGMASAGAHTHTIEGTTGTTTLGLEALSAGSSNPHNNMPPYLVVNVWKRTA